MGSLWSYKVMTLQETIRILRGQKSLSKYRWGKERGWWALKVMCKGEEGRWASACRELMSEQFTDEGGIGKSEDKTTDWLQTNNSGT